MSFLDKLLGGGVEAIGKVVGGIIDDMHTSDEEKLAAKLQLETLWQADRMAREQTMRAEMAAKQEVIVAEMKQGDNFTKRARPSVVYVGLLLMLWNYGAAPYIFKIEPVNLPAEFWYGWSGVVATWMIGRTREKTGQTDKITKAIMG